MGIMGMGVGGRPCIGIGIVMGIPTGIIKGMPAAPGGLVKGIDGLLKGSAFPKGWLGIWLCTPGIENGACWFMDIDDLLGSLVLDGLPVLLALLLIRLCREGPCTEVLLVVLCSAAFFPLKSKLTKLLMP